MSTLKYSLNSSNIEIWYGYKINILHTTYYIVYKYISINQTNIEEWLIYWKLELTQIACIYYWFYNNRSKVKNAQCQISKLVNYTVN